MAELKKPTTYQEQLNILKSRGIEIKDPDLCISILEKVSYYRLTAYFLPFKLADGTYCPGTEFARVYRIYEFDRILRRILFSALEEVEIYMRSKLAYYHSHKYGELGYEQPGNFSQRHDAQDFKKNLDRELYNNRKSAVVKHHNNKYGGKFPLWVAVEFFSFGMLSRFYGDMKTPDQKQIARQLYHSIPKNIDSWLRCCTDLRNICAHYGRLYYRIFPATPANVGAGKESENKLWGAVLALRGLYPNKDKWNNGTVVQLASLFEEYQEDINLAHIGFPVNWKEKIMK